MKRSVFIYFFIFTVFKISLLSESIVLNDKTLSIRIGEKLTYYEDVTGKLTVDEVCVKNFQDMESKKFHSGYTESVFWFKGIVKNKTDQIESIFITLALDKVEDVKNVIMLYKSSNGKKYTQVAPIQDDMEIFYSVPAMELPIKKGEKLYFLFSVKPRDNIVRVVPTMSIRSYYVNHVYTVNNNGNTHILWMLVMAIVGVCAFFMFYRQHKLHYFTIHCLMTMLVLCINRNQADLAPFLHRHFINLQTASFLLLLAGMFEAVALYCMLKFVENVLNLKESDWFMSICWFVISGVFVTYALYAYEWISVSSFKTDRLIFIVFGYLFCIVASVIVLKTDKQLTNYMKRLIRYMILMFVAYLLHESLPAIETFTRSVAIPCSPNSELILTHFISNFGLFFIVVGYLKVLISNRNYKIYLEKQYNLRVEASKKNRYEFEEENNDDIEEK